MGEGHLWQCQLAFTAKGQIHQRVEELCDVTNWALGVGGATVIQVLQPQKRQQRTEGPLAGFKSLGHQLIHKTLSHDWGFP